MDRIAFRTKAAKLDEQIRRDAEEFSELPSLRLTDFSFPVDGIRNAASRAKNREEVGLAKAAGFEQCLQCLFGSQFRNDWVRLLVVLYQPDEQAAKRFLLRAPACAFIEKGFDALGYLLEFRVILDNPRQRAGKQCRIFAPIQAAATSSLFSRRRGCIRCA
jgi:hypothetical protein